MSIPIDTYISTGTATSSKELGPLVDNGVLTSDLSRIPTLLLGVHLMVEHAKSLLTPLKSTNSTDVLSIPVPATELSGRTEEEIKTDKKTKLKNVRSKDLSGPFQGTTKLDIPFLTPPSSSKTATVSTESSNSKYHPWGSRFRAFLACMPPTVTAIGNCLSWTYEDFVYLDGSPAALTALRLVRELVKSYCVLYTKLVESNVIDGLQPYFTWVHFRWAMALIMSRQNMYSKEDGSRQFALVPLYDMVNHAPGKVTAYFVPGTNTLELNAMRDFSSGNELFMSYGHRTNTELLVYQGFLADNNSDTFSVTLPPIVSDLSTNTDPIAPLRLRLLANMQIVPEINARKHLTGIAIRSTIKANKQGNKEIPISLDNVSEAERWSLPFSFELEHTDNAKPEIPADLLAYCRVAALTKPDAIVALRILQNATVQVKAQLAAIAKAKAEAKLARRNAKLNRQKQSGGHGHSHNGVACGGHGHSHSNHGHSHGPNEECDSDEEDDDFSDEDGDTAHGHSHGGQPCGGHGHSHGGEEEELPPIYLPFVSESNETAARSMAKTALENFRNQLQGNTIGSNNANSTTYSNDGYRSFIAKYRNYIVQDIQGSLAALESA